MNPKDCAQLFQWLASGATLAEVESTPRIGFVGNELFTEQARRAYRLIWQWSGPRFGGDIGARQDRVHDRCGADFLARRFERCRRIARRLGARYV